MFRTSWLFSICGWRCGLPGQRVHGNIHVDLKGDAVGAVVLYGRDEKNKFGDTEQKLAMTAATFLGRQMEQ